MPVAIDTSVLIEAERKGGLDALLPESEEAFYVPAHAAAEFLVGAHLASKQYLRERARRLYEQTIRPMVESFDEAHAAELAALTAELRRSGQTMGFFDAAIAATVLARGDQLLVLDADFDRLSHRMKLLKS
jgi:predicted nucleic acid-binding protein